jgi:hypothetical protein
VAAAGRFRPLPVAKWVRGGGYGSRHGGDSVMGLGDESGSPCDSLHGDGVSKQGVSGDCPNPRSRRPMAWSKSCAEPGVELVVVLAASEGGWRELLA